MKTGSVAKLFGIDPKTVTGWVDEFSEFFSDSAIGDGLTQRSYLPEDLIVLNTIKAERSIRTEAETIRAKLATGHRNPALPPQETTMNRESSLALYGQLTALQTQLESERREKEQMMSRIDELEDTITRLNKEKKEDAEKLMNEAREREGDYREQIGELKAMLRIFKDQSDAK
ncbi:MAG: hypothetical protein H7Y09_09220 [Chitinophagaceae bacterium]|nr:hypothetical protein [Anaerolineae bacterium]